MRLRDITNDDKWPAELATRFTSTATLLDTTLLFAPAILGALLGSLIMGFFGHLFSGLVTGLVVGFWVSIIMSTKLSTKLRFFADHHQLYMDSMDRKNPFCDELRDALRHRRALELVAGPEAERERQEFDNDISELRAWPYRLKGHDGDRFVASMRSEYVTVHEMSRRRLAAFDQIEREITDGVQQELGT